jgi:F-type H+-transporting ATPase subunit gamma
MEAFTTGQVDSVYLVYNEFKSVISQRIVVERLLPIPRLEIEPATPQPGVMVGAPTGPQIDYLYEPTPAELFDTLIPRHVEVQAWRALLESNAAFYAAQMTAMDSASRNAADMIDQLTLYMNKVRQAAITREIIEVVSGAEAL